MFAINGSEEGPPSRIGLNLLDMGTGMWGAMGCLAALHRRTETGEGGIIDASLLETSLAWMSLQVAQYSSTRVVPARDRMGASKAVVFAAFQAADKELAIAAGNDRLFAKLAEALGHPEWSSDPRYATNSARLQNRPALHAHIGGIIVCKPVAHWQEVLGRAGVPCSAINDIRVIDDDPQIAALDILKAPPGSDLRLVGFPFSIDGVRPAARSASPRLGEHTSEVMGKLD
jgi:crotonobetainyl-CoA:carnitine CoA-transferase CaiB-like acyl-CoA transferase